MVRSPHTCAISHMFPRDAQAIELGLTDLATRAHGFLAQIRDVRCCDLPNIDPEFDRSDATRRGVRHTWDLAADPVTLAKAILTRTSLNPSPKSKAYHRMLVTSPGQADEKSLKPSTPASPPQVYHKPVVYARVTAY